jgi:hypothetical protein
MKSPVRTGGLKTKTDKQKANRAKRIGEAYYLWPLKNNFYIYEKGVLPRK